MQDETDINESFLTVSVIDIVQDQYIQGAEVGITGSMHAANHPSRKSAMGDDHAVFKFAERPGVGRGEVFRGDNWGKRIEFGELFVIFHSFYVLSPGWNRIWPSVATLNQLNFFLSSFMSL
jgi:hypothetical protein